MARAPGLFSKSSPRQASPPYTVIRPGSTLAARPPIIQCPLTQAIWDSDDLATARAAAEAAAPTPSPLNQVQPLLDDPAKFGLTPAVSCSGEVLDGSMSVDQATFDVSAGGDITWTIDLPNATGNIVFITWLCLSLSGCTPGVEVLQDTTGFQHKLPLNVDDTLIYTFQNTDWGKGGTQTANVFLTAPVVVTLEVPVTEFAFLQGLSLHAACMWFVFQGGTIYFVGTSNAEATVFI